MEQSLQGRLTHPMSYDAATDRYLPISWADAFALVGGVLNSLESPDQASFYTSGRLSNEATFLYQLFAREYGTNNLPDCSNMCHEASGRALKASLGTGKGTADLEDWEHADALFILGVNAASNAPRMLTSLAEAYRRGAQIVHINPLVEAAATRTIVPHEFAQMAMFKSTRTSTLNLQVRPGGDLALTGVGAVENLVQQEHYCAAAEGLPIVGERESAGDRLGQARYVARDHDVNLMVIRALDYGIDRDGRAPAGTQHTTKFRQAPHRVGKEHQSEIAEDRVETLVEE